MRSFQVEKQHFSGLEQDVLCPVELDYIYEILDPSDRDVLIDAADCLADTFAGVVVDGVLVSEPMTKACSLSKEDMFEFVLGYLDNVAHQRLCCVARDKQTGKVVGATVSEDFNPYEEPPVFEGNLKPMNTIISFLGKLDKNFIDTIIQKTGKPVFPNEYVHAFMAGARLGTLKRFVIIKLVDILIKESRKRGYKGIFVEATNDRSAKKLTEYCGFHQVYDSLNNPIQSRYADHEVFNSIPPTVATNCVMLYKPLFPEYDV